MIINQCQLCFNFAFPPHRVRRPNTSAGRWVHSRFPVSPRRADLIAVLAGFSVEGQL